METSLDVGKQSDVVELIASDVLYKADMNQMSYLVVVLKQEQEDRIVERIVNALRQAAPQPEAS